MCANRGSLDTICCCVAVFSQPSCGLSARTPPLNLRIATNRSGFTTSACCCDKWPPQCIRCARSLSAHGITRSKREPERRQMQSARWKQSSNSAQPSTASVEVGFRWGKGAWTSSALHPCRSTGRFFCSSRHKFPPPLYLCSLSLPLSPTPSQGLSLPLSVLCSSREHCECLEAPARRQRSG